MPLHLDTESCRAFASVAWFFTPLHAGSHSLWRAASFSQSGELTVRLFPYEEPTPGSAAGKPRPTRGMVESGQKWQDREDIAPATTLCSLARIGGAMNFFHHRLR